jgi:hypothetical protein
MIINLPSRVQFTTLKVSGPDERIKALRGNSHSADS